MAKKHRKNAQMYKGLPLVDADEDMEICVTKADVTSARKKDAGGCAAANAIRREQKTDVEVHISRTYVKDPSRKRWIRFITPQSVSREITSFDRAAIFEPGTYNLKAPGASSRLGVSTGRGGHTRTPNPKKPIRVHHHTVNIRESAKKAK